MTGYTIADFERALDRDGADLARWPTVEREAALALLEASPEARQLLAAAQAVEAGLASAPPGTAPPGLADRIVARALAESPPKGKPRR